MKISQKILSVILLGGSLSGCVGASSNGGATEVRGPINSTKKAFKALNAGDVKASLELGDSKNLTSSSFTTGFMNMNSASQYVEQPVRFRATLGNSPAAEYLRKNGSPVFVYASTQLKLNTVDNKPGAKPRVYTKPVRLQKSACDGYRFALTPQNNYSIEMSGTQRVEIRSKGSSSINAGVFSVSSSNDWQVTGAQGATSVVAVRSKPFMVVNYGGRYKNVEGFGPVVAVSRAISKDCRYLPQKSLFSGKSSGPVSTAPGAP